MNLYTLSFIFLFFGIYPVSHSAKKNLPVLRQGKHKLTLHWIGWKNPGKADVIKKSENLYTIRGEQLSKTNKDFLKIQGTLEVTASGELVFSGAISSMANGVNGNKRCEKFGTYHFRSFPKASCWRLQEMTSCEGNGKVDYIDIYY